MARTTSKNTLVVYWLWTLSGLQSRRHCLWNSRPIARGIEGLSLAIRIVRYSSQVVETITWITLNGSKRIKSLSSLLVGEGTSSKDHTGDQCARESGAWALERSLTRPTLSVFKFSSIQDSELTLSVEKLRGSTLATAIITAHRPGQARTCVLVWVQSPPGPLQLEVLQNSEFR